MIYNNAHVRRAFAEVAGLEVDQIILSPVEGGFALTTPSGVDWADYEPQPDLEIAQPDDEEGNPQPPILQPQAAVRHPRPVWDWYREQYPHVSEEQPTPEDVAAWVPPEPEPPAPVSAFEIAVRESKVILAAREEQAKGDITELKSRVAVTLVATKAKRADGVVLTKDNVNDEGSRFVVYHAALISAYKDAGGNPEAGQALYNSIASKPSKAAFPWLSDPVLAIFAATLLVESPAP